MGTVALVQAKDQDNAHGPSNQHLWAPLGKQEHLECPSAQNPDTLTPKPCLMWLQQNSYQIKLDPKLISSLCPL